VEPLPDLETLTDDELVRLIADLNAQESQISYERRLLQGRLDILRAEERARLTGGSFATEHLREVLSQRLLSWSKDRPG